MQRLQANGAGYSEWGFRSMANGIEYNPSYDKRLMNKGAKMDGYSSQGNGQPSSNGASHGSQYQFKVKKDEHVFTCASGEIEGKCPLVKVKPIVYVNAKVWDQWIALCDEVETEWIAYFRAGQDSETKDWSIEEFYFPAQTATGTSVDVPTGVMPRAGMNGAVHSHVNMGVFWSQTDKDHSNWPIEIVINARGQYEALVRIELKCGSFSKMAAEVKLLDSKISDEIWDGINKAFKQGSALERKMGNGPIAENEEPEPAQVALVVAQKVSTEKLFDRAIASAQGASLGEGRCGECNGLGMIEVSVDGRSETELCPKCNGWGMLLDGKPVAAREPETNGMDDIGIRN
jgi:hypothetical protein